MRDFVVVGAGPPGSRFARRAAERGHDVLAFESGELGEPLACSGHVSLDLWEYVPDDAREELYQNDIYGARFHTGGPRTDGRADDGSGDGPGQGSRAGPEQRPGQASNYHKFYKETVISNAIDRVGLDRTLARAARDAGAEVREHHTVTAVDEREDRVVVDVSGPDGTSQYEASAVAGCDGPRSRVRDEVGLPEPDEFLHGVLGFDEAPDHGDFVDVHLIVPDFFAWRIPRGEAGVEYGLAVSPGDDAPARFREYLAGYDVEIDRRCSGLIPIGPPDRVTTRRCFLVGDAAGQTKPFTGGGILYGMRAADHAAREIAPDDPATLRDYERAWRDDLRGEQRLGKLVRVGYGLPKPVQDVGLGLLSGEIGVHMDRPSSLFSREQLRALLSRS